MHHTARTDSENHLEFSKDLHMYETDVTLLKLTHETKEVPYFHCVSYTLFFWNESSGELAPPAVLHMDRDKHLHLSGFYFAEFQLKYSTRLDEFVCLGLLEVVVGV